MVLLTETILLPKRTLILTDVRRLFGDWSNEVSETENVFHDTKENVTKSKKERIKEMDKVIKEDLK